MKLFPSPTASKRQASSGRKDTSNYRPEERPAIDEPLPAPTREIRIWQSKLKTPNACPRPQSHAPTRRVHRAEAWTRQEATGKKKKQPWIVRRDEGHGIVETTARVGRRRSSRGKHQGGTKELFFFPSSTRAGKAAFKQKKETSTPAGYVHRTLIYRQCVRWIAARDNGSVNRRKRGVLYSAKQQWPNCTAAC